jgi:glycosyltransferase involved in cell wall biosynthesis
MNDELLLISVIMPNYNYGQFIEESICSVLNQTYKNLELIIIDNYSDDNTDEIISKFSDNRMKVYKFNNNGVIAASRNFGISKCSGDIVAFIDSDDIWLPNKLEKQLSCFSDDKIVCVGTDFIPLGETKYCKYKIPIDNKEMYRDFTYNDIVLFNPVINSSVLIKRNILLELGGLDENPDFRCIEDWELWLRVSRMGTIRILTQKLIRYRIHNNIKRDNRTVYLNILKLLNQHFEKGFMNRELFEQAKGNYYLSIGGAFLKMNDRKGLNFYWLALKSSTGISNKLRSIGSLCLFYIPLKMREILINIYYSRFAPRKP